MVRVANLSLGEKWFTREPCGPRTRHTCFSISSRLSAVCLPVSVSGSRCQSQPRPAHRRGAECSGWGPGCAGAGLGLAESNAHDRCGETLRKAGKKKHQTFSPKIPLLRPPPGRRRWFVAGTCMGDCGQHHRALDPQAAACTALFLRFLTSLLYPLCIASVQLFFYLTAARSFSPYSSQRAFVAGVTLLLCSGAACARGTDPLDRTVLIPGSHHTKSKPNQIRPNTTLCGPALTRPEPPPFRCLPLPTTSCSFAITAISCGQVG